MVYYIQGFSDLTEDMIDYIVTIVLLHYIIQSDKGRKIAGIK